MLDLVERDGLLKAALDHTAGLKGKPRDVAIFDYLAGAAKALHLGYPETHKSDCPPWLWVIGIRGGTRVAEIERMLAPDKK